MRIATNSSEFMEAERFNEDPAEIAEQLRRIKREMKKTGSQAWSKFDKPLSIFEFHLELSPNGFVRLDSHMKN